MRKINDINNETRMESFEKEQINDPYQKISPNFIKSSNNNK